MEIILTDKRIIERLNQLAKELNQTPEQVISNAIEQFSPTPAVNGKAYWEALKGIGDSGDPDLAYHIKDILHEEVDPLEGWSKQRS